MSGRLTHADAFREIGRRIESGEWKREGICRERSELTMQRRLDWQVSNAMADRIRGHVRSSTSTSMYAYRPGLFPGARAMACYWMALEAEEEVR